MLWQGEVLRLSEIITKSQFPLNVQYSKIPVQVFVVWISSPSVQPSVLTRVNLKPFAPGPSLFTPIGSRNPLTPASPSTISKSETWLPSEGRMHGPLAVATQLDSNVRFGLPVPMIAPFVGATMVLLTLYHPRPMIIASPRKALVDAA